MKGEKTYNYALKLPLELKSPLKDVAKKNRRDINKEITYAVEQHIKKENKKSQG